MWFYLLWIVLFGPNKRLTFYILSLLFLCFYKGVYLSFHSKSQTFFGHFYFVSILVIRDGYDSLARLHALLYVLSIRCYQGTRGGTEDKS